MLSPTLFPLLWDLCPYELETKTKKKKENNKCLVCRRFNSVKLIKMQSDWVSSGLRAAGGPSEQTACWVSPLKDLGGILPAVSGLRSSQPVASAVLVHEQASRY